MVQDFLKVRQWEALLYLWVERPKFEKLSGRTGVGHENVQGGKFDQGLVGSSSRNEGTVPQEC
jgi:hypothetical protein